MVNHLITTNFFEETDITAEDSLIQPQSGDALNFKGEGICDRDNLCNLFDTILKV